jgi:hypothetical protein
MTLTYGNAPVPYTVLWSSEDPQFIGVDPVCPSMPATCNSSSPGEGRPMFGTPHMQRQREAVVRGLCDICGKTLKGRTKVSLSHARVRTGADGLCVMQVEPLLHKECATVALKHCPSLRRDIRNGTLNVRMVTRYRTQIAQLTGDATEEFTGTRCPGALGHAKVELLNWQDKDAAWLEGAAA